MWKFAAFNNFRGGDKKFFLMHGRGPSNDLSPLISNVTAKKTKVSEALLVQLYAYCVLYIAKKTERFSLKLGVCKL